MININQTHLSWLIIMYLSGDVGAVNRRSCTWIFIIFFCVPLTQFHLGFPLEEKQAQISTSTFFLVCFFWCVPVGTPTCSLPDSFCPTDFPQYQTASWWEAFFKRQVKERGCAEFRGLPRKTLEYQRINETRPLPLCWRFHVMTDVHRRRRCLRWVNSDCDKSKGRW